jgi:hypothetical protein
MKSARWIFAMIAVLLLDVACSKDATGGDRQAGTLTLRLTTPHADDGAMTFQVSGAPIDSAFAANGSLRLFTRRDGSSAVVGVVVGVLADGAGMTLHVPDVGATARYAATVLEVADRQDALRTSLAGYALTVAP